MSLNHQWSILWPTGLSKEALSKAILLQLGQSSSQILISNQQPIDFYTNFMAEKPEFCRNTYLKVPLERSLLEKSYRIQMQDRLCFLSEEYTNNLTDKIHWQFKTSIILEQKKDFSRFLMDILVFYLERFSDKFKNISIFIDIPSFDLKDTIEFLRSGDSSRPIGLSYFPYYYEKQGFEALKTSFIWKPWASTILLADVGFDFKTEVPPGEGIVPNKSVCQIVLEIKKPLSFIFNPLTINFEKKASREKFFFFFYNFITTLSK